MIFLIRLPNLLSDVEMVLAVSIFAFFPLLFEPDSLFFCLVVEEGRLLLNCFLLLIVIAEAECNCYLGCYDALAGNNYCFPSSVFVATSVFAEDIFDYYVDCCYY